MRDIYCCLVLEITQSRWFWNVTFTQANCRRRALRQVKPLTRVAHSASRRRDNWDRFQVFLHRRYKFGHPCITFWITFCMSRSFGGHEDHQLIPCSCCTDVHCQDKTLVTLLGLLMVLIMGTTFLAAQTKHWTTISD